MALSGAQYDVFLCYNTLENEAASWLRKKLENEGLRVFLDDRVLIPGASLPTEISTAVVESFSFIVLLGPSGLGKWQSFEIDIAVQKGIQDSAYKIIVVLLPGANAGEIPPSLQHRLHIHFSSDLDDSKSFHGLIRGLRGDSSSALGLADTPVYPRYRSMAPHPIGFVQRPELEAAIEALTRELEEPNQILVSVGLTTALRGAGGFGKTALAQAVCEDNAVRARFPAGILWITLGQRLSEAQRLARVMDLLRWWTRKEPASYETLDAAASVLRDSLSGQRVLLVLDDVWLAADVTPFVGIAAPAALLITTRNTRALPTTAYAVIVDALELPRAVELLGQGLTPLPPASALERLAKRLGEWAILLKLVNAQLVEEYRSGVTAEEAFRVVEATLDEMGLTAFDREDEEARNLAVRRTVEASLQRLSPEDQKRYAQLAVFPEDERIPMAVLELLWDTKEQEVSRVCRRLAEMSLLYQFNPVDHWIQLHDVMRAYLLREHRPMVQSFHEALVDSYLDRQKDQEARRQVESYFVARLPYHLKESGREHDLVDLLFSYSWLENKLAKGGVNAAMADYELLPDLAEASALREALLLSRSVLTKDRSQLASQLHGRLAGSTSDKIKTLLEGAIAYQSQPWLRPLTATFQRPSDPLRFSLQAHQGEIRAIAQLNESIFATAGTDGEIHIWDFAKGDLLASLSAGASPVRHLGVVDHNHLIATSDDGVIRLWDLEEEQVIRSFDGHRFPITAFRLWREEFISGAKDGSMIRWSLSSDKPLGYFKGHQAKVTGVGYLNSRTLVSIAEDRTLRVWNIPSGRQLKTLIVSVFSADVLEVTTSNEVILGTFAGEIQIWKPRSGETRPRRSFIYKSVGVGALCMLAKDLGVSPVGFQSEIQLWDPSIGALGAEVHVSGGGVTALARFDPGYLLCGSKDGSLSVWAVADLRAQMRKRTTGSIYAVAAFDDTTSVSTSPDGSVNVWKVHEGVLLRSLEGHSDAVSCVCALDSNRIASSSASEVRAWNPRTGELLKSFQCNYKIGALTSFGGNLLVVAPLDSLAKDQPIQIWDVVLGQKMTDLPQFPLGIATLYGINGRFLILGSYDGPVLHLEISTASPSRNFVLKGHEKGAVSIAIINSNYIASGSLDTTIRIWDLAAQETAQILKGHESAVTGLASISSRFLVSASSDQTIKLWDLKTGTPIVSLYLDTGLSSLAAMPDGKTLVAGDVAGIVHFLRLEGLAA